MVVAQVLGATAAAFVLYLIATGKAGASIGGFAANGTAAVARQVHGLRRGADRRGGRDRDVRSIMGATDARAPAGFARRSRSACADADPPDQRSGHNTSVNPARSTSRALSPGSEYLGRLWLFWLFAPVVGGAIGALVYRAVCSELKPAVAQVGSRPAAWAICPGPCPRAPARRQGVSAAGIRGGALEGCDRPARVSSRCPMPPHAGTGAVAITAVGDARARRGSPPPAATFELQR